MHSLPEAIEKIIREEIESLVKEHDLQEGWWDKLRAKTAGAGETIKGATSGLRAKVGGAISGTDPDQTPHGKRAARSKTMAKFKKLDVILKARRDELYAVHKEFRTDLEGLGLAGPSIDKPSNVMRHLNTIFDTANGSLEKLQEKVDEIILDGEMQEEVKK